jgi:allophanate hydrolase subunit 2
VALATVIRAGVATIQDGGRPGYAHLGVPVSGALHRARYLQATAALAGVPDPTCPAIELLRGEVVLRTHVPVAACVVGAVRCLVNGRRTALGTAVEVPADAQVDVRHEGPGPAYLVMGGWVAPRTLGSAATDTFSRLGGAVVASGLALHGDPRASAVVAVGAFHRPVPEHAGPVRVVPADSPLLREFAEGAWQVTQVARSGVRLHGGTVAGAPLDASGPVLPGAIQVTPAGEAIILGPDGGVTGGYPVVGVVASADLDRLSLLDVGDRIRFRVIDVPEAARAFTESEDRLRRGPLRPHAIG